MAQSGVLSSVAPTLSWMVLPPLMTQALLRGLYSLQILTPPSTPAQSQMYKQRAQAAVIVGYLVYIVYAAFLHGPTNYYELLQVGLEDDTETIRRSFRRLARIHHPDKVGATVQNEAIFLDLRRAHDALVEPVRRTMYDHFGTAAVGSTVAMAQRDTFFLSLQGSLIAYGFGILFLGLPRWWFQGHSPVNYWYITFLLVMLSSELALLISPTGRPPLVQLMLPTRTIHDVNTAMRQVLHAVLMASAQIAPHLPSPKDGSNLPHGAAYERSPAEIRNDLVALRDSLAQHVEHSAQTHLQASQSLDISLLPLRPRTRANAETLQEAAAKASARRANARSTHEQPLPEPSTAETTFMHLMSKTIQRARLEAMGAAGPSAVAAASATPSSDGTQASAATPVVGASDAPSPASAAASQAADGGISRP